MRRAQSTAASKLNAAMDGLRVLRTIHREFVDHRKQDKPVNEVLRYDAPIQDFSRHVAGDVDTDGVLLPAGSRAIVFYGAANRDERKYPTAESTCPLRN